MTSMKKILMLLIMFVMINAQAGDISQDDVVMCNAYDSFTMQFVDVERVADAKIRLQTDDIDSNNDTIHRLIEYKYKPLNSASTGGETIEKKVLASWVPSVANIESYEGVYNPATVRAFFDIQLNGAVLDVTGFEDVADLEKCPVATGLIADYRFLHASKAQAKGAIDRYINMLNNYQDAIKTNAGVTSMQQDRELLIPILEDLKILISMTDGSRS